jgi:hypothetical protein
VGAQPGAADGLVRRVRRDDGWHGSLSDTVDVIGALLPEVKWGIGRHRMQHSWTTEPGRSCWDGIERLTNRRRLIMAAPSIAGSARRVAADRAGTQGSVDLN